MKHSMLITCAMALAAVTLNGRLDAAVSSDIVGYQTVTLEGGKWYMIGLPFASLVEDDTGATSINDIYNTGFAKGDQLYILDSATNTQKLYYWNVAGNGWSTRSYDSAAIETDVTVTRGQAVYIYKGSATAGTLTLSGKVSVTEVSFGVDGATTPTWNQVAVVWPDTVNINDITWSGMVKGDQLYIIDSDSNKYSMYYWNVAGNGWSTRSYDSAAIETDVTIYSGQALYIYKTSGTATLTYSK